MPAAVLNVENRLCLWRLDREGENKQMDKEIEKKLIEWVKNNYSPKACGYTEMRSSGNESDVFCDGYDCGISNAAYEIGCILGMKLKEPEEQDYDF